MKAVVINEPGGPEVLSLQDVSEPSPGKGEVLVEVKATAVNRADVLQRRGHYPPPPDVPADIPGLEFAGVVASVGPGVTEVHPGDRVCGLAGGGTYAEYLCVHARTIAAIPESLSFAEAAAIPEVFVTAYDAMIVQAGLKSGETVLISAVGSGVGTAAVQVARVQGARSIGTARHEEKLSAASELGLNHGLLVTDGKFSSRVISLTRGLGVDVAVELVGGGYIGEDIQCMGYGGRLMVIGLVAGAKAEVNFALALRKRLRITGTTLRMRPLEEKILAGQLLERNIMPLFERGLLKPVIDKVYPLAAAGEAHAYMERDANVGKLVLEVG